MKRTLSIIVILFLAVSCLTAQKIDASLTNLLSVSNSSKRAIGTSLTQKIDTVAVKHQFNVSFDGDCTVRSFSAIAMLEEGSECPTDRLQQLGITIVDQIGRMLILRVPAESLLALNDMDEIVSVSADQMNQLMNNNARIKSKVSEVATQERAIANKLPQAYTGKGVMVGIIDSGIDFNHAAFRNADGTSRVKMVMIFGNEDLTTNTTDANEIAELTSDRLYETHGTHVAAIAAGSIVEGLDKQGMAPEADLLLCGMSNNIYESSIIQAIKNFFDYAKSQNKPCVINCSIGNVLGFHDGTGSAVLTGLKEYYKTDGNKEGNICVFSAGNSGGHQAAIYTTMPTSDSDGYNLKTVLGETGIYATFEDTEVSAYRNINNFFYNTDGSELDVDVKVVDVTTGKVYTLEEKPLYTSLYNGETVTSLNKIKDINPVNGKHYVRYYLYDIHYFQEPNLKLAYFVKDTEGKTFRAIDKREDTTAGYYSCGLTGYTDGCDNGAFSVHLCGEEVIGVGAYVSSPSWQSLNGETLRYKNKWCQTEDAICDFSSWGTDENSMNHPDVIAPGSAIISAYNIYDGSFFDRNGNYDPEKVGHLVDKTTLFDRKHYYGIFQGTSMAAPHVTGVIALWLQANPRLTYSDVRALLKETSYKDKFTTDQEMIPSKNVLQAGAGKIDALEGLRKIISTTTINGVEVNNPRPVMMDEHYYNMLGQPVGNNTKGIIIHKGKKVIKK